ncbi:hypothetical protein tb265_26900 [Gemmatimonadetes bacterium T265]|nr:hypothetical protein tb265_26900 [Gemmatimonadetes bacterium T265]
MHPPLQELADLLARTRDDVLAAWDALPPDTRERRPSPESWTPAEVLDHLRLVEAGSAALLAKRLQRAREAGLGAETDQRSRLDTFDAPEFVHLPPFDAPEPVRPAAGVRAADAEAGLRASRAALDRVVADADGFALGEVRARHLRFGEIDFYQWLLFVAAHERRHLGQLLRLRDALAPTPTPTA